MIFRSTLKEPALQAKHHQDQVTAYLKPFLRFAAAAGIKRDLREVSARN